MCELNLGKKIFKKQPLFKKFRRKIRFLMQKNIKPLMVVVGTTALWTITHSKSSLKTLEQGVKYVQRLS